MLVGSLVSLFMFPIETFNAKPDPICIFADRFDEVVYRNRIWLVAMHAFLMVSCWLNSSSRFNNKILNYFCTFLGMFWYIFEILSIALNNYMTPPPNSANTGVFNTQTAAIITWGRIELYVWFGIVVSNIVFMFLRSLIRPALDPTVYIDDKKKIPQIDTIIALQEVASLFHTEFVPFWVSNC